MATSERSPRSTTGGESPRSSDAGGVGMAHLTVVPTNFDEASQDDRRTTDR